MDDGWEQQTKKKAKAKPGVSEEFHHGAARRDVIFHTSEGGWPLERAKEGFDSDVCYRRLILHRIPRMQRRGGINHRGNASLTSSGSSAHRRCSGAERQIFRSVGCTSRCAFTNFNVHSLFMRQPASPPGCDLEHFPIKGFATRRLSHLGWSLLSKASAFLILQWFHCTMPYIPRLHFLMWTSGIRLLDELQGQSHPA